MSAFPFSGSFVIGTVTGTGRLRVLDRLDGEVLADIPAASLDADAPLYDRPLRAPGDLESRRAAAVELAPPDDVGADLLGLLADPSWVYQQYDHQLVLNTVEGPGGAAAQDRESRHHEHQASDRQAGYGPLHRIGDPPIGRHPASQARAATRVSKTPR